MVRMWKKETPCAKLDPCWIGAATMENSMEVPQKVKNRTIPI